MTRITKNQNKSMIQSKLSKFSPLQKKIIEAQFRAADGDAGVAIGVIDEALSQFKPRLEIRKLLEKAREEFDCGSCAVGETFLQMALDAPGTRTVAPNH